MKASKKGIDFIKRYESFSSKVYYCQAGKPTIGYGHVITKEESHLLKATITKEEALKILARDLERFEKAVLRLVKVPISQTQFDMLVSFAFNTGEGQKGLAGSTLLKKVNLNPNDQTIKDEFSKWVWANGMRSNGLIRRRKEEGEVYFT